MLFETYNAVLHVFFFLGAFIFGFLTLAGLWAFSHPQFLQIYGVSDRNKLIGVSLLFVSFCVFFIQMTLLL